jgi:hypothetical protein
MSFWPAIIAPRQISDIGISDRSFDVAEINRYRSI